MIVLPSSNVILNPKGGYGLQTIGLSGLGQDYGLELWIVWRVQILPIGETTLILEHLRLHYPQLAQWL